MTFVKNYKQLISKNFRLRPVRWGVKVRTAKLDDFSLKSLGFTW